MNEPARIKQIVPAIPGWWACYETEKGEIDKWPISLWVHCITQFEEEEYDSILTYSGNMCDGRVLVCELDQNKDSSTCTYQFIGIEYDPKRKIPMKCRNTWVHQNDTVEAP